ncbi:MAG: hypothetical protein DRN07_04090 [Thermoplasmata archaeon]|nr:MAG: hypothetical protein DRN07_04090 [Thermoplasmata archaeon]
MEMAARKEKKEPAIKVSERKMGEPAPRRPYDLWLDMDRLFDRFRAAFDDLFWPSRNSTDVQEYRQPPMDIIDHGDRYEMRVDVPGIPKENVDISVTQTGVEISAKHENVEEEHGKNWLRRERSSMDFYRCVEFPEEIKPDKVEAEMNDGVLTITFPKAEPKPEYKPKKIKIK